MAGCRNCNISGAACTIVGYALPGHGECIGLRGSYFKLGCSFCLLLGLTANQTKIYIENWFQVMLDLIVYLVKNFMWMNRNFMVQRYVSRAYTYLNWVTKITAVIGGKVV